MSPFTRKEKRSSLGTVFSHFRKILQINNQVLGLIARMEQALGGEFIFDRAFLRSSVADLAALVRQDIYHLNVMTNGRYVLLFDRFEEILDRLAKLEEGKPGVEAEEFVLPYVSLNRDMDEFVGSKNASLAETGNALAIPVPQGFALTTRAYSFFLEANGIPRRIAALADLNPEEQAERISGFFVLENMPPSLRMAIDLQVERLAATGTKPLFAVRSSAVGEDGEHSFAGQFASYLQVAPRDVASRCLQVMASRFSANLLRGLAADALCWELPMAVGVQLMVETSVGGVIYSRDPAAGDGESMVISAAAGGGRKLVSGETDSDQYLVGRRHPFPLRRTIIGTIPDDGDPAPALRLQDDGLHRGSSVLTVRQIRQLAETALIIEKHFGRPQDIEWAIDPAGRLVILQCRRLYMAQPPSVDPEVVRQELAAAGVLMKDRGQPAQLGVASGKICYVDPRHPPAEFPVGAIAVSRTADPALSGIIRRAAAILTEVGSPTGHLASIAREYRTPALFGCGNLSDILADGREITVDVEERAIYEGRLPSLEQLQRQQPLALEDSAEMRVLRRMLRLITPLNLTGTSGFAPEQCRTFHDLIRFCHEKAVETLTWFPTGEVRGPDKRVLQLSLPLRIRMVDLGGGIADTAKKELAPADIACRPFKAILQGMLLKGAWENEPVSLGIRDLLASALRTPNLGAGSELHAGDNLAIVAEEYVNLSLRLGYHFNVIDSYLCPDPTNNYIYFRFVGGMADAARRARRAELIGIILRSLHFQTELLGDVVVGKARMLTSDQAGVILGRLGQLVAFTRQLDVRMVEDAAVDRFLAKYLDYVVQDGEGA
ncbi:MAG: PEP/pyruvate-binding domain-containing protein [Thermodesulfobacteriota bacterium]